MVLTRVTATENFSFGKLSQLRESLASELVRESGSPPVLELVPYANDEQLKQFFTTLENYSSRQFSLELQEVALQNSELARREA